jgi:hypothetical protein
MRPHGSAPRAAGLLLHLARPDAPPAHQDITEAGIDWLPGEPRFINTGSLPELFAVVDAWLANWATDGAP